MINTDVFSILTQRKKEQSHHETKVAICWDGVTEQQLKIMARAFIVHVLQSEWKQGDEAVPEHCKVQATEMVHMEIFIPREYKVKEKLSPLDEWIKQLDPADVQGLLKQLQAG